MAEMAAAASDFSVAAAKLHAKLPAHRRAVERATARIQEALATVPGTWAVSCSGGKDSTAMLALAVEAGWRGPLFFFRYRETPPENEELVQGLAARYDLHVDCVDVVGAWDAFERVGHFFASPGTDAEREAVRWMNRTYKRQLAEHQAARGWAGVIIGMRKDESKVRRFALSKKGHLYTTANRPGWTCCPLIDWSARDVWAVIETRGLPWLDRYSHDMERERSEATWLAVDCWRWGMAAYMKRRDPENWNKLVARWPELASQT